MSTPTRTRASRKSPAERSAEIADAARLIALEHGLAAVTLRAVATRVGVAPALVAHYQPNMDVLVGSTFATVVGTELAEVREHVAALPSPRERLAHLLETLLDGTRDDVTVVWVEAWALGRRNEPLAEAVRTEMDDWRGFVQGIIESGVASGEFETDDAASVAWQLLGMIDGLNAHALVRWEDAADRGSRIGHAVEGMLGMPRGALASAPG
ncbi:AcrR family transcriptional regulator [Agromyces flavus]|uniref:AcrR family transcriptional regulator n=1 Tax=Agromyces flavus TaxID=589382 RepID=A0A1H1ZVV0_9MICO|nr:TetR family transcriptional regulator C-terminal domain-containing protein [Agromyces flavus]MCP2367298.1 AcrR family transcriptional regulator [Agromyces flavus]GGI46006.1 transcriptional regulator [Agromyces flavus]SDT37810.1 DNA-binding transcriptional regulator, AcrR family [Agromyces flavus]